MLLPVVHYNDPVLRATGQPVDPADATLPEFARDMLETMYASKGIGLAAQQVGRALQFCVVDVPEEADKDEEGNRLNPDLVMPMVLLNPRVLAGSKETWVYEEGCLSFPEIHGRITRPVQVTVEYQDLGGKLHRVEARGLLGRCLQHEIDHLNGILFIDRMSAAKRMALASKLKRLARETAGE